MGVSRQLTDEPTTSFHRLHARHRQIRIDAPDDVTKRRLPRHWLTNGLRDDRHHRPRGLRVRHEDLASRLGIESEMADVLGDADDVRHGFSLRGPPIFSRRPIGLSPVLPVCVGHRAVDDRRPRSPFVTIAID